MEEKDIKMLDAFVMNEFAKVTTFEMLTHAMVYVRAAAQAGGKVNLMDVYGMDGGFEDHSIIGDVFNDHFLTVFGEIEPWPEEKDEPTPEEEKAYEEWMANMTHYFTLNENGWKFAEQIDKMWDVMSTIIPTQKQVDAWMKDFYEERKKHIAELEIDE